MILVMSKRDIDRAVVEAFRIEAAKAGDMVAVVVCELAMGDEEGWRETASTLGAHDAYRLERLDLDGNAERAATIVSEWIAS
jgi:hypothetical protein